MRIEDMISAEVKQQLNYNNQPKHKRKQRKKINRKRNDDYSRREIEELMGVRKPTYKRVRGAYRQR